MAVDVVPELKKAIETDFRTNMAKDAQVKAITKRIRDGTATLVDGHRYAEQAGKNLSKALRKNLTAETLPDGKLYYNIAKRTVEPTLKNNYELVNKTAAEIQELIDYKNNIGLKAIKALFPDSRIIGLIDKMTEDDIELDDALAWLDEPIVNNSEAFFDDYVKANADFRQSVGMKTTIRRITASGCCDWCGDMSGTYDYKTAPPDIYRRHEHCRCDVIYESEKKLQNVWSKKTFSSEQELQERRNIGR